MSMMKCHECGRLIDTDDDPGCWTAAIVYPPDGSKAKKIDVAECERCRELDEGNW